MRKLITLLFVASMALPVFAGDMPSYKSASGWIDMEGCSFCKNLTVDPELLPHSTWETHPTNNGMIEIITVEPEYKESFAKAGAAMEDLGQKIMAGEVNPMTLPMCGRCQEFGMLMMTGVKTEQIMGDAATVFLYTSDNPDVVKKMHDMVARDHQEMALLMGGHEGHQH